MVNDPVSDFLTRLRNACLARKKNVIANQSKMTKRIAEILNERGYIDGVKSFSNGAANLLDISLKYDSSGRSILDGLKRISTPGLRSYCKSEEVPLVRDGLGISILSTSRGVMTGDDAKKLNVGGEVLCLIW